MENGPFIDGDFPKMAICRDKPWIPFGKQTYIAIENGPVEIDGLPLNSIVIFHSYVNVYQRVVDSPTNVFDRESPTQVQVIHNNWPR